MTQTRAPDLGLSTSTYDAAGNVTTTVDANMKTISMGYDELDRVRTQTYDGATATFTYDASSPTNFGKGHLTGSTSPHSSSSTQTTYDERGRVRGTTRTIQGVSATVAASYDVADRMTGMTYPDMETVATEYDAADRATKLQGTRGTQTQVYAQNGTYSALDKRTSLTLGNGTSETWSYDDALQRLGSHTIGSGMATNNLFNRSYAYDKTGNVQRIGDTVGNTTQLFTYDERDRLTRGCAIPGTMATMCATGAVYDESDTYNEIGNLLTKGDTAYTYPASGAMSVRPHAPTVVGASAYTYDAVGNTLTGAGRTLTWNSQNRPVTITGPGTGGGGMNPTVTFTPTATAAQLPVRAGAGGGGKRGSIADGRGLCGSRCGWREQAHSVPLPPCPPKMRHTPVASPSARQPRPEARHNGTDHRKNRRAAHEACAQESEWAMLEVLTDQWRFVDDSATICDTEYKVKVVRNIFIKP